MLHPIPKLTPAKEGFGLGPVLSFDMVNDAGEIQSNRKPTIDEVFKYLGPPGFTLAMNERADFELWRRVQQLKELETVWGTYTPGMWRGQPNKHAVKHHGLR